MGVERREMPAGAGRNPAPQGRVLEGLGEVAQGQPVLAQLVLQPGPGGAGLDPRRQRLRVDLQHPIQPAQIERDHRPIPQPRLDPTDHAGPAAKRHHRGPLRLAPGEHRLDLRLVPGKSHQIRRVLEFPPEPPHHIPVSLAQSMRNPLVVIVAEQIPESARSLQPRRPQLDRVQRHRLLRLPAEPKPLPDPASGLPKLLPGGHLILVPPPPVLEPSFIHANAPL